MTKEPRPGPACAGQCYYLSLHLLSSSFYLAFVTVVVRRSKRYSAKNFARLRGTKCDKTLGKLIIGVMVAILQGKRRGFQEISHFHQLVRIGALIAAGADR